MSDEKVKHRITTTNHRGEEVVLSKPLNESAMTQAEREEWHKQRNAHLMKQEVKKDEPTEAGA